MDRTRIIKRHLAESAASEYFPATPTERIDMVWPLTREVATVCKEYDAERR
jgi:hypothetical protein